MSKQKPTDRERKEQAKKALKAIGGIGPAGESTEADRPASAAQSPTSFWPDRRATKQVPASKAAASPGASSPARSTKSDSHPV